MGPQANPSSFVLPVARRWCIVHVFEQVPARRFLAELAKGHRHDADRDLFNHSMKLGVMVQDLPVESNRVDLDPNVVDAFLALMNEPPKLEPVRVESTNGSALSQAR